MCPCPIKVAHPKRDNKPDILNQEIDENFAIRDFVDRAFPHGHSAFNDMMLAQMKLHSDKNKHYAGGGEALGNFERVAKIMDLYPNFPVSSRQGIAIMYALKHFDAVMWNMCRTLAPPDDSLGDLAVYFTLIRCMNTK